MVQLLAIFVLALPAIALIILAKKDDKKGVPVRIPSRSDWYK